MRSIVTTIVALMLLGPSGSRGALGQAHDVTRASTAADHLTRGLAFYERRDYDKAIAEFLAGYKLEPRREFLFALGQAERLSGDCASAIVYYRQFLTRGPSPHQADATWELIRRCERALASGPRPALEPRPARAPPPAKQRTTGIVSMPARPAWYTDKLGGALLAGGAILVAVGGGLVLSAAALEADAASVTSYERYATLMDIAGLRRKIATATLLGGGVLVAAAVYRYVTRRAPARERHLSIERATPRGGIALSFGGSF